jgi:hypothetical protein
MGKGKALLLHLLAVVAGWGMVAGLRPVVGSWAENRRDAEETPAPAKSGTRTRTAGEVAAGRELLLGIEAQQRLHPQPFIPPSPEVPIEELIDKELRRRGIDPAAPAPTLADGGGSGEDAVAAAEYHQVLAHFLDLHLNGEHGPDLAHAFRQGRMDALAIYDLLAAHLPGVAADHTLRCALYRELAPRDPVRAEALLAPMTEAEAMQVKYQVIEQPSSPLTPDATFALLASVSAPTDFHSRVRRVLAWATVTESFLPEFGSDYLDWLEQLPAGVDRDFAGFAVAQRLPNDDLASHQRLRVLITGSYPLEGPPPR